MRGSVRNYQADHFDVMCHDRKDLSLHFSFATCSHLSAFRPWITLTRPTKNRSATLKQRLGFRKGAVGVSYDSPTSHHESPTSVEACDQCRKTKSKCERVGNETCKGCALAGTGEYYFALRQLYRLTFPQCAHFLVLCRIFRIKVVSESSCRAQL